MISLLAIFLLRETIFYVAWIYVIIFGEWKCYQGVVEEERIRCEGFGGVVKEFWEFEDWDWKVC